MAEATSPTTMTDDPVESGSALGAALDAGIEPSDTDAGQSPEPAGDTAVPESQPDTDAAEETTETQSDEDAPTVEDAEESSDEPALPSENEADFSAAVYDRFAKHFAKTNGVEIDLNDPVHKALIRENILRGRALAEQRATQAAPAAEETAETEAPEMQPADEAQMQPAPNVTTQQIWDGWEKFTAERINPEFAKLAYTSYVKAMWPNEVAAGQIDVNDTASATNYVKAMMPMGIAMVKELLPQLSETIRADFAQQYPLLGNVHDGAIRESAIENIENAKGTDGKPLFPELSQVLESRRMEQFFKANPDIKNARYTDAKGKQLAPVANAQRKFEIALRMLRGERPSPDLVKQAVETGKKLQQKQAAKVGASKLNSGGSKGGFASQKSNDFVADLLSNDGEDKFHAAIERSRKA